MGFLFAISAVLLCILCYRSLIAAQQLYAGKATTNCSNMKNSVLGYSCNGVNTTCQAYLIFRSQPPYTNVASISTLLGSDPSRLAAINSVSETQTFETNKIVIVPVNCSCSGQKYQANTSYVVRSYDTPFSIANNTYQGLSTCQAIQNQSSRLTVEIYTGDRLAVPLRCACPTKNQSDVGIRYLLSYLVTLGDTVSEISAKFGAETGRTLQANDLSEQRPTIYPFTTLLVPLNEPPSSSQTIVPPPPPTSPAPSTKSPSSVSNNGSSKAWIYAVIGLVAGIALTLVLGAVILFAIFRWKKQKQRADSFMVSSESLEAVEKQVSKKLDEESDAVMERVSSVAQSIKVYKFEELQAATDNFSPSRWIAGSVYSGLINGDYAAIKKVNGDVSKEINLLNKLNHSNLILLSGVCFNDGHWYLVYEYAANGSLSDWIYYTSNCERLLNWAQRIQIALDVATGLNYLHSFTSPPHVHKDIKSSNILLDADFRAKIANLSLARSAEGREGEFTLTSHIVGTKGYMAPEYLENGLVSTKLDVYAFGILLLEMLTGKEVATLYQEGTTSLSDVLNDVLSVQDGQEQENLRQFIDPSMDGNYPLELAIIVVRLIDSCLHKNPVDRPVMDEVLPILSRILSASLTWEMSSNISGYQSFSRNF